MSTLKFNVFLLYYVLYIKIRSIIKKNKFYNPNFNKKTTLTTHGCLLQNCLPQYFYFIKFVNSEISVIFATSTTGTKQK